MDWPVFDPFLVNSVVGFIGPDTCTMSGRLSGRGWRTTSWANC